MRRPWSAGSSCCACDTVTRWRGATSSFDAPGPPMVPEPWSAVLPVLDALDEMGVPWHLGGSVASGLHGVYRSTNDVDVIAALRPEHAKELAGRLAATHACDESWVREAIAR